MRKLISLTLALLLAVGLFAPALAQEAPESGGD